MIMPFDVHFLCSSERMITLRRLNLLKTWVTLSGDHGFFHKKKKKYIAYLTLRKLISRSVYNIFHMK